MPFIDSKSRYRVMFPRRLVCVGDFFVYTLYTGREVEEQIANGMHVSSKACIRPPTKPCTSLPSPISILPRIFGSYPCTQVLQGHSAAYRTYFAKITHIL